jgi:arginase
MDRRALVLDPAWQACRSPAVRAGVLALAGTFLPDPDLLLWDPPAEDAPAAAGVAALGPLAEGFRITLARLRHRRPDRILLLGATCGAEAAPVAWLNERCGGDLAVVWCDAHGDLNRPEESPSGLFHGMILRTLLGEGPAAYVGALRPPLRPAQVFPAGVRDLDPAERDWLRDQGVPVWPCAGRDDGLRLAGAIRAAGFTRAYLHLDVDVLDPERFAGALMATPGGPSLEQLAEFLGALVQGLEVVGASVVEFDGHGPGSREQVLDLLARSGLRGWWDGGLTAPAGSPPPPPSPG